MPGLLSVVPDAWGPKGLAASGALTRTRTGPNEIVLTAPAPLVLVMLTPQPGREIALGGSRRATGLAPTGAVELVPAGAELFARWRSAKENLLFALDEASLAALAGAEFQKDEFELHPPTLGMADGTALMLARLAGDELSRGAAANPLCLDALITLTATHVLRHYSSLRERPATPLNGGLTPKAWRIVDEHIRGNLASRLSVASLAAVAGLSPSHFLRAFRRTTGESPHRYVMARRIDLAERLLARGELSLSAIAAATGFAGNSHMTATMKRLRGRTPKEYRQEVRRDP